jgi:hypothetical protein
MDVGQGSNWGCSAKEKNVCMYQYVRVSVCTYVQVCIYVHVCMQIYIQGTLCLHLKL